jgi:hypothetical protein
MQILKRNFLSYIDSIFFFLPFSSPTQAAAVAKTAGVPPSEWTTLRDFWLMITAIPRTTAFSFRC